MKKIYLASKSASKIKSLELALKLLGIKDYEIETFDAASLVTQRPINEDTLKGARNRANDVKFYLKSNNIPADFVIAIEGGYEQLENTHNIVSSVVCIDMINNTEVCSKSLPVPISETMYNYALAGNSINKLIEKLLNTSENKSRYGVTGILSNNSLNRVEIDKDAIVAALSPIINNDIYKTIDTAIIGENKTLGSSVIPLLPDKFEK